MLVRAIHAPTCMSMRTYTKAECFQRCIDFCLYPCQNAGRPEAPGSCPGSRPEAPGSRPEAPGSRPESQGMCLAAQRDCALKDDLFAVQEAPCCGDEVFPCLLALAGVYAYFADREGSCPPCSRGLPCHSYAINVTMKRGDARHTHVETTVKFHLMQATAADATLLVSSAIAVWSWGVTLTLFFSPGIVSEIANFLNQRLIDDGSGGALLIIAFQSVVDIAAQKRERLR